MSRIEKAMREASKMREILEQAPDSCEQTIPNVVVENEPSDQCGVVSGPRATSGNGRKAPQVNVKITNPLIVTRIKPESREAEEYRRMRSLLIRSWGGGECGKIIAVTSAIGSEGKSVTALNLAIAFAHDFDHTVLLIDADVRKSSLSTYMNIGPRKGLSDCILGNADPGDVIVRTGIGDMSFIPVGSVVRKPSEFFSSHAMKELIHQLKSRYDDRYVIIDTPPIMAFSETMRISDLADGVILVIQEGKTKITYLDETLNIVGKDKVLGVVYTKAFISSFDHRYDRYYRYGYPVTIDAGKGNDVRKVL